MDNWSSVEKRIWKNICEIYFLTKNYILKAEEISLDLETFLQPVKEHRDALDHIVRVYGYNLINNGGISDLDAYREENMKKALGHVYRAFFDTADWLSFECRRQIRITLSKIPIEAINSKYSQYDELKEFLATVPLEIAHIRATKDIGKAPSELIDVVQQYKEKLDLVLKYYTDVLKIFPVANFSDV